MSTALASLNGNETKWTIMSGSMKGTVRLMSVAKFAVGRSTECQFILVNDPKCSRKHALVENTAQGFEIESLSEQNPVLINGKPVQRSLLTDGDLVVFGDTEVMFNLTTSQAFPSRTQSRQIANQKTQISLIPAALNAPLPEIGWTEPAQAKRNRKRPKSNPLKMVIYAVIGLVVLLILLPTGKKKDELTLRTEKQIQADIEAANKLNEAALNQPGKKFEQTVTGRQAQENYVRGFRDYRKGQYERALDSFQTCLSLDPNHILCNRYYRLADRKFNELIEYNLVLGRKYRDQNQFQACRAAFRNVMVMEKDSNSKIYQEAKANYEACTNSVEGHY